MTTTTTSVPTAVEPRRPAPRVRILGREPALWVGLIEQIVLLLVAVSLVTGPQGGAILAVTTALFGLVAGLLTRPVAPAIFAGLIRAVAALLLTYGVDLRPELVVGLVALASAVQLFIVRGQVEPRGAIPAEATAATSERLDGTPYRDRGVTSEPVIRGTLPEQRGESSAPEFLRPA